MDFLGAHNPTIDFAARDMRFANDFCVASDSVHSAGVADCDGVANVQLCLL